MGNKKKLSVGIIVAVVAIVIVVVGVLIFVNRKSTEEKYRIIQVEEVTGSAYVNRGADNAEDMDVFQNMMLQSMDRVWTLAESSLTLKLDSEKYMTMEADTEIYLEADGLEETGDTLTRIHLEKGTVLNQINTPLMELETYEVVTPSATMAVRGTEFKVTAGLDDEAVRESHITVDKGTVEIYREGKPDAGSVFVPAGYELDVKETDEDLSALEPYKIGKKPAEVAFISFDASWDDLSFDGMPITRDLPDKLIQKFGMNLLGYSDEDISSMYATADTSIQVIFKNNGDVSVDVLQADSDNGWFVSYYVREGLYGVGIYPGNNTRGYIKTPVSENDSEETVKNIFHIDEILEKVGVRTPFKCNLSDKEYMLAIIETDGRRTYQISALDDSERIIIDFVNGTMEYFDWRKK